MAEVAITGAKVTRVNCPACGQHVRVRTGDIGAMTLDDIIDAALAAARSACRDPGKHSEVRVGAGVFDG